MPRVCITVPGKNSQPYRFSLDRKLVRLGRAVDNDIIIDCPSVSSHHCEMRRVEGGYTLQDLDSTNGIKADGTAMEVLDLENDLVVLIGDADLDFELTDDENGELKKESHESHAKPKLPAIDKEDAEDSDDEEEDEKPKKKKKEAKKPEKKKRVAPAPAPPIASANSPLVSSQQNGALSFGISMAFLILAAIMFYLGMATSHSHMKKDESLAFPDDKSLMEDLLGSD